MKYLFGALVIILVAVTTVVFYSCEKETLKNNLINPKVAVIDPELQDLYKKLPSVDYGNIKIIADDILQFESNEHYQKVVNQLTEQYEAWSTLFFDTYGIKATDDELDAIQETLGFTDWMPMIQFEEQFKIYGKNLRFQQRNIEDDWLAKGTVDLPVTDNLIIDPAEQTLLNQYREACIKDTICQVREDACILIPIEYIAELPSIRSLPTQDLQKDKRVKVVQTPVTCYNKKWYKEKPQEHPVNEQKFIWKFSFDYSWFYGCTVGVSKMSNYKKNKKGNWVACMATCALGHGFKVYFSRDDFHCEDMGYRGRDLQNTMNLMSRTIRTMCLSMDNNRNRIDPAKSKISCRHKGWTFTYDL